MLTITSQDSVRKNFEQPAEIQLLDQEPQAVALVLRRWGPVQQVVEVAQRVGHPIHQIEIGPAIEPAEGGVGQFQHVEVLHRGRRIQLCQRQGNGLGRAQMARSHRRRKDQDASRHGREFRHPECAGYVSAVSASNRRRAV